MTTTVKYSAFYTRNLQNFENAKVGFELETDDQREGETLDEFKTRIKAKVDKWVEEAIEEVDREAAARR